MMVKMVVVGDCGVGKTSLLIRYTTRKFPKEYANATPEGYRKNLSINNTSFVLGMFDTAGSRTSEKYRQMCYPQTHYFVLCYSIARQESFDSVLNYWMPEIKQNCPEARIILVATKNDLRSNEDTMQKLLGKGIHLVTKEQGKQLADEIGAVKYMECSALNGFGVDEIFEETAVEVFVKWLKEKGDDPSSCTIC